MASSNIKLFDENKSNMLTDTEFNISTQRLNGLQTGVASSQLQNKAMYQVSLVAYAIAQIMMQNGKNANDTDAVSTFVANLSGTMLQKVYDLATTAEAQAGVATGKWMSPALVKAAIDALAAKAQNILSSSTKALYGLGDNATPDDVLSLLSRFNNGLGNEYVWKRTTSEIVDIVDNTSNKNPNGQTIYTDTHASGNPKMSALKYYKTAELVDGVIVLGDEFTPTSQPNTSNKSYWSSLCPFYIVYNSDILYLTSIRSDTSGYINFYAYYTVIGQKTIITPCGYVNSPNADAYPPTEDDGYIYTALGCIGDILGGKTT